MVKRDIEAQIKIEFQELRSILGPERLKYVHPKSTENIIFHLLDNPKVIKSTNSNLQKLGTIRTKEKLLEFFKVIRNLEDELDDATGIDLYKRYFIKIGSFMGSHYGFSGFGGFSKIYLILFLLLVTISIDTLSFFFFEISIPYATIISIVLFTVRFSVKYKRKKIYGLFY